MWERRISLFSTLQIHGLVEKDWYDLSSGIGVLVIICWCYGTRRFEKKGAIDTDNFMYSSYKTLDEDKS